MRAVWRLRAPARVRMVTREGAHPGELRHSGWRRKSMTTDEAPETAGAQGAPVPLRGHRVENRITRVFSLQTDPFTSKHDPRFVVGSKPMRKALVSLRDHLKNRSQLILITGEAGIGKTALLDAVLRDSGSKARMARIDDPTRGWAEIGQEIGAQLELAGGRLSPGAVVTERGHGRILRIFIDSAQCLPEDSLRHLQAYLDLQAPPGKDLHLVQLVLIARNSAPAPVFGWLREREHQRVGFERLDSAESRRYVLRRLRLAAGEDRQVFSEEALHRIAQATDGLPGAINQMCHVALDMAASQGDIDVDSNVDSELIQEVSRRLKESRRRHRKAVIAAKTNAAAESVSEAAVASEEQGTPDAGEPPAAGTSHAVEAPSDTFAVAWDPGLEVSEAARAVSRLEVAADEEAYPGHRVLWEGNQLLLDEIDGIGESAEAGPAAALGRGSLPRWSLALASLLLGGAGMALLLGFLEPPVAPRPEVPLARVQVQPAPAPEVPLREAPSAAELDAPEPEPPPVVHEVVEEVVEEVAEEVARDVVEKAIAIEAPTAQKPPPTVLAKLGTRPVEVDRAPRPRPSARAATSRATPPLPTASPQPVAAIPKPALQAPAAPVAPARSAREVLELAFARFYDSAQTRTVEIFEHADSGESPVEIFKLARKQERGRTLSLGVLVGAGPREERRILSIETGEADDKRFAYLPESGKTISLTRSAQLEPFEGTPFRYDDFRPVAVERFHVYGQERSEGATGRFTLVSAKPRHRAPYSRVEFLIDRSDYTLLERHYYRGSGLRPYRIVQTPRESMQSVGGKLVPMRLIARDLKTGGIAEAKVVDFDRDLDDRLDSRLFTLVRIKEPELDVPNF